MFHEAYETFDWSHQYLVRSLALQTGCGRETERRKIQPKHTDKVAQSWPNVPGDLRLSVVVLGFSFFCGFVGF